jgi:hypothetical protein
MAQGEPNRVRASRPLYVSVNLATFIYNGPSHSEAICSNSRLSGTFVKKLLRHLASLIFSADSSNLRRGSFITRLP